MMGYDWIEMSVSVCVLISNHIQSSPLSIYPYPISNSIVTDNQFSANQREDEMDEREGGEKKEDLRGGVREDGFDCFSSHQKYFLDKNHK